MLEAVYSASFRAGFAPSEFWACTPYATALHARAKRDAIDDGRWDLLWQAWHVEAFARTKRLPPLGQILAKPSERKPKTPAMIDAILFAAEPKAAHHG